MLRKSLFLLTLILVLVVPTVYAGPFSVTVAMSEQTIVGDDPITFVFTLANAAHPVNITPQIATSAWKAEFSSPSVFLDEMPGPGRSRSVQLNLTLTPTAELYFGAHDLTVRFIADADIVEQTIRINRVDQNPREPIYLSTDSEIPQQIDPNYAITMKLVVINQENIPKPNVGVRVTAGDFLTASSEISLQPYERKEIPFTIPIAPGTQPQDAELKVFFVEYNSIVAEFTRPLKILPVELELREKKEERTGFLTRDIIYKVHNPSNIPKTGTFAAKDASFFGRIFSSSIPEAQYDRTTNSYVWEVSLQGDEITEVVIKYNYRGLFYLVIVIVLVLVVFHFLKPDIFISKSISRVSYHADGTLAGAKIVVHLKNKTRETLRNISVAETIPEITHYQQKAIAGSLEPSSIKQLEHTTVITWKIDELSPGEERLVSYVVRSRLGVVGSLTLPASRISFVRNEKKQVIYSNTVLIPTKVVP